jgi:3-deoxy-D-manno-octulosonic-acid transferase
MTRWLYSCVMWLAQPLLRRKLARRGLQEPGYLEDVEARFGHYAGPACQASDGLVWIHAVSLGETRTAAVLVQRLREQRPGVRLLLTHGTATGRAEGQKLLREGDLQTWQPWDTPGAVQRFLAHFQPRIGILMETEIWPNLVDVCQQQGVPLVLANARMSDKSQRQAQRLAWLSRPAFGALTAVWAQTRDDAARLTQLGAPRPQVFGNLKFDVQPNPAQLERGRQWRTRSGKPVVLFASSREGEEALFLQTLQSFRALAQVEYARGAMNSGANAVQCLIVPRHPQRFDEVATLIEGAGLRVSRRSGWADGPPLAGAADDGTTIWLGDSLGEMALYYGLADVALLGGSFAPLGGQNLIEAAACGCPVLMGPHTFNFAEAAELAQAVGAARRVDTLVQAVTLAQQLVQDPAAHAAMVQAATGFASAHGGAVDKTTQAVAALLAQ